MTAIWKFNTLINGLMRLNTPELIGRQKTKFFHFTNIFQESKKLISKRLTAIILHLKVFSD